MNIVQRLRQGVDPDNIQETEQAMDCGADEIDRQSRVANDQHRRCLDEINRLQEENGRLREALEISQNIMGVARPSLLTRFISRLRSLKR